MRGRFTPDVAVDEWCERRLLARIHRYTVKRLRAEIEPVAARDFLRFLLGWQRVAPDAQMEGPDAVEAIVGQLEGFEAPAGAWETEILPARIAEYEPAWLDDLCLAGRIAWARLRPLAVEPNGNGRAATPVRTTPIALLPRRQARLWAAFSVADDAIQPSSQAQRVVACIREQGASFFDELVEGAGPAAPAGRRGAGRTGRPGPRQFGQLWRAARIADAVRPAPARRQRAAPSWRGFRHGGRRPLGARPPRPAGARRDAGRGGRARGAQLAAPLRGGVLASAGARGCLAAALARSAARLSPARSARRDPRRPLCRRLLRRAIRAARGDRHAARDPAQTGFRCAGSRFPAPIRSTSPAS